MKKELFNAEISFNHESEETSESMLLNGKTLKEVFGDKKIDPFEEEIKFHCTHSKNPEDPFTILREYAEKAEPKEGVRTAEEEALFIFFLGVASVAEAKTPEAALTIGEEITNTPEGIDSVSKSIELLASTYQKRVNRSHDTSIPYVVLVLFTYGLHTILSRIMKSPRFQMMLMLKRLEK